MISATELSDCVKPSTTPCSSRGVACVIRLVSVGRTMPPIEVTSVASASIGIEWQNASRAYPTV